MRYLFVVAREVEVPIREVRTSNRDDWLLIPLSPENHLAIADRVDLFSYTRQLTPWDPVEGMSFNTRVVVCELTSHSGWIAFNSDGQRVLNLELFSSDQLLESPVVEIEDSILLDTLDSMSQPAKFRLQASDHYNQRTSEGLYLRWDVPSLGFEQAYEDWTLQDYIQSAGPLPPLQRHFMRH